MNQILEAYTPEQEAELALQSAMQVVTRAKAVVVQTDADYRAADTACAAIKAEIRRNEDRRDDLVRPLNTVVKKINAGFKDVKSALEQALDCYRKPMTAFQQEQTRIRAEAEAAACREREALEAAARAKAAEELAAAAKLREAAADPFEAFLAETEAAAHVDAAKEAFRSIATIDVPVYAPAKVTGGATKTMTVWDFEITDPALVPLAYRPIDLKLVAAEVRAMKGETSIPGILVFSRQEVK